MYDFIISFKKKFKQINNKSKFVYLTYKLKAGKTYMLYDSHIILLLLIPNQRKQKKILIEILKI